MKIRRSLVVVCAAALFGVVPVTHGQAAAPEATTDGSALVRVSSRRLDAFDAAPGADFRGYTKVLLDPVAVAFRADWLGEVNQMPVELSRRTSSADAARIADVAGAALADSLSRAFKHAGYEIAAAPGADVLRISPRVVDLFINAPAELTTSPRTRVYTVNAGEAKLMLEIRDATTGALVARAVDTRTARDPGNFRLSNTTTVSNGFDFGNLFDAWAQDCVTSLEERKTASRVAANAR